MTKSMRKKKKRKKNNDIYIFLLFLIGYTPPLPFNFYREDNISFAALRNNIKTVNKFIAGGMIRKNPKNKQNENSTK
jgi:hypothetical protein